MTELFRHREAMSGSDPQAYPPRREFDATRPSLWELVALASLVVALLFGQQFASEAAYDAFNWIAPISLISALMFGAARMTFINGNAVWASLFWFRLATATYFGFGSLAPLIVNPTSKALLNSFYAARPDEVYKLNLIVAASSLIVIGTSAVLDSIWPRNTPYQRVIESSHSRLAYAVLFGGVGYAVKLLVEAPMSVGAYGAAAVPGIILQLSQLSEIGLYLLTLHAFKSSARYLPLAFALLSLDMLFGALQFSKFAMLLPLIMFLLGWVGAAMSVRRVLLSATIFLSIYTVSQPYIEFGRARLEEKYNSISLGSLSERWEILEQYSGGEANDPFVEQAQSSLMRLSYVNASCFAISRFDGGNPGPSLDFALATLFPRFIWPEKPIITDLGVLFNLMATGNANSSSAPGYFADAYWTAGWEGVLLLLALVGALFTFFSRYAINALESSRRLHFPLVLLAMKMGLRVDGALVSDVVGASVIWFWAYVAVRVAERPADGFIKMFAPQRQS